MNHSRHAAPGGHGPPSDGNAQGRWSAASRRGTNTKSYQVAHAAPGGHGPPSDGNAQGRWSAASRRGTNTQRIRALRLTTVERANPINLPSCIIVVIQTRTAEDRLETTIKAKSYQVAHAAPGGHGPPSDGNAQGRWSAASRRGTNTRSIFCRES